MLSPWQSDMVLYWKVSSHVVKMMSPGWVGHEHPDYYHGYNNKLYEKLIQVVECGSMDFKRCCILGEAPGLPDGLDVGGGEGELLEGDVLGQKQLRLRGEHALAECCPVV